MHQHPTGLRRTNTTAAAAFCTFTTVCALALAAPALASGSGHPHAHGHAPQHGGVVVEVKDVDYELVAKPTLLQLYLRDHGQALNLAQATAKLTLLSGGEKQAVELKPAGNRLEARGSFKLGPGAQAVAVVTLAGKPATVRFVLK